jgi:cardiolipin synthase
VARIGSTNLNLNSWVGNWELDVAIEDAGVARTLEEHYEEDLDGAREILREGAHGHTRAVPSPTAPSIPTTRSPAARAPPGVRRVARCARRRVWVRASARP